MLSIKDVEKAEISNFETAVFTQISLQSIKDLEKELLGGQSAQGPPTAAEVYQMLKKHNMIARYFSVVTELYIR